MTAKQMREAFDMLGLPAPRLHFPSAGFRAREWQGDLFFDWADAPPIEKWDGIVHDGAIHFAMNVEHAERAMKGRMTRTTADDFIFHHWADHKLPIQARELRLALASFKAVLSGEKLGDTIQLFTQS